METTNNTENYEDDMGDENVTWEEFVQGLENYTGRPSGFFDSLPEDMQQGIRDAWEDGRGDAVTIGNAIDDYFGELWER